MNVLRLIADDLNTRLLEDSTRYTGKVIAPNIQRLAEAEIERLGCARPQPRNHAPRSAARYPALAAGNLKRMNNQWLQ